MPLEDLSGNKYVNALNENWPAGTDYPDAGDDHMRGIKNVLKKTFPNLTGPVTITQDEMNRTAIPVGSVMVFYQAAVPTGWTRTPGFTLTYGLRIVPSTSAGGAFGGADDPISSPQVPSHTHSYSTVSGVETGSHTHTWGGTSSGMSANASHSHTLSDPGHAHTVYLSAPGGQKDGGDNYTVPTTGSQATSANGTGISIAAANTDHTHYTSGTTSAGSGNHQHAVSGTVLANSGAAIWTPRYVDVIVCTKQ